MQLMNSYFCFELTTSSFTLKGIGFQNNQEGQRESILGAAQPPLKPYSLNIIEEFMKSFTALALEL